MIKLKKDVVVSKHVFLLDWKPGEGVHLLGVSRVKQMLTMLESAFLEGQVSSSIHHLVLVCVILLLENIGEN